MPEEDAFALLIALMDSYCLRDLYMPGAWGGAGAGAGFTSDACADWRLLQGCR
jgi:hypothetical protein